MVSSGMLPAEKFFTNIRMSHLSCRMEMDGNGREYGIARWEKEMRFKFQSGVGSEWE